jgi:outer membrane protein assembly factor BamB
MLPSARHRIYALNANSGKKIWSFDPFDGGPGEDLFAASLIGKTETIKEFYSPGAIIFLP